jgi:hypothetical protein
VAQSSEVLQALETTDTVVAVLSAMPERDPAIGKLIAAIVRDRAQLLVAGLNRTAPVRIRNPAGWI